MNFIKSFQYLTIMYFAMLLISCGGSSKNNSVVDPIPNADGFTATADNRISDGQISFAFGQSASFNANTTATVSWSASSGTITSDGVYQTPKDFTSTTSDTITLTFGSDTDEVNVLLNPFPILKDVFFQYSNGNQKYSVQDLTSQQAIGVAVFANNSNSGEGNLTIKNLVDSTAKKYPENLKNIVSKLDKYNCHSKNKGNNLSDPLRYSKRHQNTNEKNYKKTRASDALGTRDSFYHDEGSSKGAKTFEKIYSGAKCLIYSEVNPTTDAAYVSQARGLDMGNAFEVTNPFNPEGTAIYDFVTALFGHPWGIDENGVEINGGGRDGEAQVVLLLYHGGNAYGYFYWVDEEEKGFVNPVDGYISNGTEMIYLNDSHVNNDIDIFSSMAHEFQHLCDYNQAFIKNGNFTNNTIFDASFDSDTATLFNEGKSLLSEDLNGFSMSMANNKGNDFIFNEVNTFRATLSSFTPTFYSWNSGSDYGKGYIFWRYLYDTYGREVVKTAAHSEFLPPKNLELATGKKMDVLMQEFLLALMQTDSDQPINSNIKITNIELSKTYFDSFGGSIGKFDKLDYSSGFIGNKIQDNEPYVIRLYKILPKNGQVDFTIENIKKESSYSIVTAIVNQ